MDVHMPEMDGYEATQAIRAFEMPQSKQIPIIAMTANVFQEDIDKCLAAGMNYHIGKPIFPKDIYEKLKKYLSLMQKSRNEIL
jgi:CheY-like chemotaxis protein